MQALVLTREYLPHVYGGAGVVVDQLTRAPGRAHADRGALLRLLFTWDRIAERTARVYADALDGFSRRAR